MLPHLLTNFEIQNYYQNESKFKCVYLRNDLPKLRDGANMDNKWVINLDEFKPIGTHWTASYVNSNNIIYFGSFGVEHTPKEIIGNKTKI